MKVHKISIKNKRPEEPLTAMNTEILMDGQPLLGVTSLKLEVDAKAIAKITLEMIADFELEQTHIDIEESK